MDKKRAYTCGNGAFDLFEIGKKKIKTKTIFRSTQVVTAIMIYLNSCENLTACELIE